MSATGSTERFSGRADVYDLYRPGYPPALLACLRDSCGLAPARLVADVGSGTGKLSEVFLVNGNTVYAVEPNRDMRDVAERTLSVNPRFHSVNGVAEATTLPTSSVDMVAAGQAFHWFDPPRARVEFRRILRPGGIVALVWNVRDPRGSPFLEAYDGFLRDYSIDYETVSHRRLTEGEGIRGFFEAVPAKASFPHPRALDFDTVAGGYLSCSYALPRSHPRFAAAMKRLRALFDAHQENGMVGMPLRTDLYHGTL